MKKFKWGLAALQINQISRTCRFLLNVFEGSAQWHNVFRRLDSWTGLTNWTCRLDSLTELETALNNNLGINHLLKHWRHQYRAITAGNALPHN